MKKIIETYSASETLSVGTRLGKKAKQGQIVCLDGDLGTGKTVFTKGFALGLNIDEHITSPTFTIVNRYVGRLPLYHLDVYRIGDPDEMYDIGYEELFFGDGVCLVEWAELIEILIPDDAIHIKIEKDLDRGENYRKITVTQKGD